MSKQTRGTFSSTADIEQSIERYSGKSFRAGSTTGKAVRMLGFSAAAAGGLVGGSQAEADIVYSGVQNTDIIRGTSPAQSFDLDGNGIDELALVHNGATNESNGGFKLLPNAGFEFIPDPGSAFGYEVYRGARSAGSVSTGRTFSPALEGLMGFFVASAVQSDPWGVFATAGSPQTGLVGFRFNGVTKGGGTGQMFGWMRIRLQWDDDNMNTVPGINDTTSMTLVDWAYENIAGDPIHFGAVPEPSSAGAIAMLALGALGVRRRRKQTD